MESKQPVEVKVVDVAEKSFFAAKLGLRVSTVLTVEFEGTRYQIRLAPQHTRVAGFKATPKVGDSMMVRLPR